VFLAKAAEGAGIQYSNVGCEGSTFPISPLRDLDSLKVESLPDTLTLLFGEYVHFKRSELKELEQQAKIFIHGPENRFTMTPRYLAPQSHPRLHIKSATTPVQRPEPMRITLQISAEGKGPVALSQDQFEVTVSPYPYARIKPLFETNAPWVFRISPEKPMTLSFSIATATLKPGKQRFSVDVGSHKVAQYDYQFLGVNHSPNYEIEVK